MELFTVARLEADRTPLYLNMNSPGSYPTDLMDLFTKVPQTFFPTAEHAMAVAKSMKLPSEVFVIEGFDMDLTTVLQVDDTVLQPAPVVEKFDSRVRVPRPYHASSPIDDAHLIKKVPPAVQGLVDRNLGLYPSWDDENFNKFCNSLHNAMEVSGLPRGLYCAVTQGVKETPPTVNFFHSSPKVRDLFEADRLDLYTDYADWVAP